VKPKDIRLHRWYIFVSINGQQTNCAYWFHKFDGPGPTLEESEFVYYAAFYMPRMSMLTSNSKNTTSYFVTSPYSCYDATEYFQSKIIIPSPEAHPLDWIRI
jgi:hypothetical protein